MIYLIPFVTAFVLSVMLTGALVALSRHTELLRRKKERGRLPEKVLRLGGLAMIAAFVGALLMDPHLVLDRRWQVLLIALGAVALVGLLDDLWILSWRSQLFVQTAIALFLFVVGIRITSLSNPLGGTIDFQLLTQHAFWLSLIVTLLWIIIISNAMNWLDGVDGFAATISLIGAGAIFVVSLLPHINQPPIAIAAAAFAGATAGFLIYNWQPARIVAGTGGAFFWGLMIAVLAIFAGAKIATALLVMTVPLVDALWVIGERIWRGQSIFAPNRRHLHHKLLDRGWKPWMICSVYGLIVSFLAWAAISFTAMGKLLTIIFTAAGTLVLLWYLQRTEKTLVKKVD